MLTSTNLSNISYNTDEFLQRQLNSLLSDHQIRFWAYITHCPEPDEEQYHAEMHFKEHKHIFLLVDTRLDTVHLDDHFCEVDPTNELPLKCMDWHKTSSVPDWFLYGVHDPVYVKLKYKEDKKYHYKKSDFVYSDKAIFENWWYKSYHVFDFWSSEKYKKFIEEGWTAKDIIKGGYVEFKDMSNFHYFANYCL